MAKAYKAKREPLTVERLKEFWDYNKETGIFTRIKKGSYRGNVGDVARPAKDGYVVIRIDTVLYAAHRLAYLFVNGVWPTQTIDHINGNPSDNRWSNLRDVSHADNLRNLRKARADNKSGYLGVYWCNQHRKWRSEIKGSDGTRHRLGLFPSAIDAYTAYLTAKRRMHDTCSI